MGLVQDLRYAASHPPQGPDQRNNLMVSAAEYIELLEKQLAAYEARMRPMPTVQNPVSIPRIRR
jgi:hypothetical protein